MNGISLKLLLLNALVNYGELADAEEDGEVYDAQGVIGRRGIDTRRSRITRHVGPHGVSLAGRVCTQADPMDTYEWRFEGDFTHLLACVCELGES